jgi:hypothetical protein
MKQLYLLLLLMPGIISTSVHATAFNIPCADVVMADSEDEDEDEGEGEGEGEDEEEPDCE